MDRSNELYNQGRKRMEDGDITGAVVQFEESIRIWPHFKTLELLGECLMKLGRLQEAIVRWLLRPRSIAAHVPLRFSRKPSWRWVNITML